MSEDKNIKNDKDIPLILVFYLDKETMYENKELVEAFSKNVQDVLDKKYSNSLAFFMPTQAEERVDCINPDIVDDDKKDEINRILTDVRNYFDFNNGEGESDSD